MSTVTVVIPTPKDAVYNPSLLSGLDVANMSYEDLAKLVGTFASLLNYSNGLFGYDGDSDFGKQLFSFLDFLSGDRHDENFNFDESITRLASLNQESNEWGDFSRARKKAFGRGEDWLPSAQERELAIATAKKLLEIKTKAMEGDPECKAIWDLLISNMSKRTTQNEQHRWSYGAALKPFLDYGKQQENASYYFGDAFTAGADKGSMVSQQDKLRKSILTKIFSLGVDLPTLAVAQGDFAALEAERLAITISFLSRLSKFSSRITSICTIAKKTFEGDKTTDSKPMNTPEVLQAMDLAEIFANDVPIPGLTTKDKDGNEVFIKPSDIFGPTELNDFKLVWNPNLVDRVRRGEKLNLDERVSLASIVSKLETACITLGGNKSVELFGRGITNISPETIASLLKQANERLASLNNQSNQNVQRLYRN